MLAVVMLVYGHALKIITLCMHMLVCKFAVADFLLEMLLAKIYNSDIKNIDQT